jgi:hypothetical protein
MITTITGNAGPETRRGDSEMNIIITIDEIAAMIWAGDGDRGASYHINDSGGLELDDIIGDGLTDAEYAEAERQLCD